jgi:sugar O-acyltransferase (sialic acid O-acetyltransferase NeuD family)
MKQIAIYGAGGFAREVAWLAESCEDDHRVVCFVDDNPALFGKLLNNIPVMSLEEAAGRFAGAGIVSGIGSPKAREMVMQKAVAAGFAPMPLIHHRAEMSRWIEMGEGTVICAGCILTTNIRIGKQVQINLDCTVGHDVVLGDYTTLAPGVHVSGWVHFGKRVYVGTGAVLINGTEDNPLVIGDDVVIGAGACVTKSISCGTWGGCLQESCAEIQLQRSDDEDRFSGWRYPDIEDGKPTKYNWVVQHKDHLRLGFKTDIGAFTYINAKYGVIIEDYVQIGSHCSVYSISTIDNKYGQVVLKKNCRIGSHSTIMPGVTIGENAVIGAHSFVNRDVATDAMVAGGTG